MILFLIFIFFIYYFNNNKEYFNYKNIYKEIFLDMIESFNSEEKKSFNSVFNIISSNNKKYFEINLDQIGFNKLSIDNTTNLNIKKISNVGSFNIKNLNNLYLNYNNVQLGTKIKNLDNENEFKIVDIESKFLELDYNKFRFIAYLKYNNLFMGVNGLTTTPEKLFFDVKIII
jgi:hypothetical protein